MKLNMKSGLKHLAAQQITAAQTASMAAT